MKILLSYNAKVFFVVCKGRTSKNFFKSILCFLFYYTNSPQVMGKSTPLILNSPMMYEVVGKETLNQISKLPVVGQARQKA